MGLHDRLSRTDQGGAPELRLAHNSEDSRPTPAHDPYAELKTRVHHAVIATLGAELFKQEANQDLSERVTQLAGSSPQFSLGKSYPGFAPIGPWLVTLDEFTDPANNSKIWTAIRRER